MVARRRACAAAVVALAGVVAFRHPAAVADLPAGPISPAEAEARIVELVNEHRVAGGMPALQVDAGLQVTAGRHADALREAGTTFHSPRLRRSANRWVPGWELIGENVAEVFDDAAPGLVLPATAALVHRSFLDSPTHRANVEEPRYNAMAVAVRGSGSMWYVVQHFAVIGTVEKPQPPATRPLATPPDPADVVRAAARLPDAAVTAPAQARAAAPDREHPPPRRSPAPGMLATALVAAALALRRLVRV